MLLKQIDLNKSLQKVYLILKIKEQVNINTILGTAILNGFNDPYTPDKSVLTFIKEQATDNPSLMGTVITPELTQQILSL